MPLSDDDLFESATPSRLVPAGTTPQALQRSPGGQSSDSDAKAETVIRVMTAAGLRRPYGWDEHDAIRLWGAKLEGYPLGAVIGAANQWVDGDGAEWPTLSEFVTVCAAELRKLRASEAGLVTAEDSRTCQLCHGDTWIESEPRTLDDGTTYRQVESCPNCVPDGHTVTRTRSRAPSLSDERIGDHIGAASTTHRA